MFNFFKKKEQKEDPILKELERQNKELKEIRDKLSETTDKSIEMAENALRKLGYTDADFERMKAESNLHVVK